ncbi:hypothetical protein JCM39194_21010 [Desulfotomaculum varum]
MKLSMAVYHDAELYKIITCRKCHHAVIDTEQMAKACHKVFQELDFSGRRLLGLSGAKPKHHDIFTVAIAGCPNACSQPQIKDFGLLGQAVPAVTENCSGCGLCTTTCPDQCIVLTEKGPQIDTSRCLNCGQCAECCAAGAVTFSKVGYQVLRGGKLGRRPRLAEEVASLTDEQEALGWLRQTIELLLAEGLPGERLGTLLNRLK